MVSEGGDTGKRTVQSYIGIFIPALSFQPPAGTAEARLIGAFWLFGKLFSALFRDYFGFF